MGNGLDKKHPAVSINDQPLPRQETIGKGSETLLHGMGLRGLPADHESTAA
jgi:hypothetical protein